MPRVRKPKTGNGSNVVVEGMAEVVQLNKKAPKAPKAPQDLHSKYAWVVKGTTRKVPKGDTVHRGDMPYLVSKGVVCDVQCTECKAVFTVNTQDAFQVKLCPTCKKQTSKRTSKRKTAVG